MRQLNLYALKLRDILSEMRVLSTIDEVREQRLKTCGSVGFVPTMGYLHEGHLSLVRYARQENDGVIVSIFVNPTQFGPGEDFDKYPRNLERDLALLEREKVDVVFTPLVEKMYPPGYQSFVSVDELTDRLEGASRPGHFKGVTTVVAKLLNIVQPNRAYFGQKDAQQAIVINKMVADLNMNLEIITAPTVREPDGLAMSSRNIYLNHDERQAALVLWRALSLAQRLWANGERNAKLIRQEMTSLIQREPLARISYISIADMDNLDELDEIRCPALVSLSVYFGKTRLIDNIILEG
jgi:pantoate--beta-alanine ligase